MLSIQYIWAWSLWLSEKLLSETSCSCINSFLIWDCLKIFNQRFHWISLQRRFQNSKSLAGSQNKINFHLKSCEGWILSFYFHLQVYLLKNDRKVSKKRTSTKRGGERNIVFNEAMIFSVPPFLLNSIQVRLTVMNVVPSNEDGSRKAIPIGHVIVGSRTDGKGLLHWHQMITSLRKPIAMFHPLRRSTSKGGDDVKHMLDSFKF